MHIHLLSVALVFGAAVSGLALRPEGGASITSPSRGNDIARRSVNHKPEAPAAKAPRAPKVEPRLLPGVDPKGLIGNAIVDVVKGAVASDSDDDTKARNDKAPAEEPASPS